MRAPHANRLPTSCCVGGCEMFAQITSFGAGASDTFHAAPSATHQLILLLIHRPETNTTCHEPELDLTRESNACSSPYSRKPVATLH